MAYRFHRTKLPTSTTEPPDKRRRTSADQQQNKVSPDPPVPTLTEDDWAAFGDTANDWTDEDLAKLDFVASQAISAPTPKPPQPKQQNVHVPKPAPTTTKLKVQSNVPHFHSRKVAASSSVSQQKPSATLMDDEVERLSAETERLRTKIANLEEESLVRDGEVNLLRETLKQKDNELFKQKQNQRDMVDMQAKDHLKKQEDMEQELDKLRTQLRFKDQEIRGYQEDVKKLKIRSPPRRLSPQKPKAGAFPTTETFVARPPSPAKVTAVVQTDFAMSSDVKTESKPATSRRYRLKTNNTLTMSGASLVSKLQNENDVGVYKLLEQCQTLARTEPNEQLSDLCHVAETGLNGLFVATQPTHSPTSKDVHFVPLLNYIIFSYNNRNDEKTTVKTRSETHTPLSTLVLAGLDIGICLVAYSTDVLDAVVNPDGSVKLADEHIAGPSGDMKPSKQSSEFPLVDNIVTLLSGTRGQKTETAATILKKCLTLLELCASQTRNQFRCFQILVKSGILSDLVALPKDWPGGWPDRWRTDLPEILMKTVRLMRCLVQSNSLLTGLCRQTDECTFHCLYVSLQKLASTYSDYCGQLCEQLVSMLTTILAVHKGGATFLLETDCICSEEMCKTLCVLLHRVLKSAKLDDPESSDVRTLRKGLLLVYTLSVRGMTVDHHTEVEKQYTMFVNAMKRVVSNRPDISDNEVTAVRYLWDFDEDGPGQDENSNGMDWDQEESDRTMRSEYS